MRSHLELEGSRFRQGWGEAFSSGPSGTEVKKRRKPTNQRGRVSTARCRPLLPGAQAALPLPSRSFQSRGEDSGTVLI